MTFWTEAQKLQAAKIWNEGGSASEVGRVFGVSRNAVIGMINRNRAMFKAKPMRVKVARRVRPAADVTLRPKPKMKWPVKPPAEFMEPEPEVAEPFATVEFVPPGVLFLDVNDSLCRWPLWSKEENPGKDGLCCGAPVDGGSWCAFHRVKARAA